MLSDDDELEVDEENVSIFELHPSKDEKKKRKGKKKNKHKSKSTTPLNPEPRFSTNGYTSTHTTTEDPAPPATCTTAFMATANQSLEVLKTQTDQINNTELVQTVLVIIAVVLSVISCTAILLMTCAQSHKNFLASYLGTGTEQEKLQKTIGDVVLCEWVDNRQVHWDKKRGCAV
ncbi:hypothetical protein F7725_019159 [Dissostichus mawsoni]|uniref:Uncharacterized protein n=1 Tax=Dissostichus mawsoni TaxID=36200 RepID=A0A7J5YJB1_DISMA|nr:hypothetical protein F7725_019159 [Dissostichus mawsoni]